MNPRFFFLFTAILFAAGAVAAAKEPPPRPIGTLIFEDSFERSEVGDEWQIHPRSFTIEDGVLVAAQQPGTDHGAVGQKFIDFGDVSLQFSFKFEGSPRFNVVIDDQNYKGSHAGHICRLQITPQAITLRDDKTGAMKNSVFELRKSPQGREETKKLIEETSVTVPAGLEPGTWHTIILDIVGETMTVRLDGEEIATLVSPGIAHPTKTDFGFTVTERAVHFDNIKAWKVTRKR